ncbi:hypothetical protein FSP39_024642 [Pinctada imbricata]|uniref:RNA-directed DNA polymerase n=1 Tax=Pinctada imbricata TaxID=66713 RepID=A0AA88XQS3_PINIB|nr:hypothetical protein FSP39_024642 [Pinctada imbricata]
MHPDKFYEIPELNRPPLQKANNRLRMADGGLVKPLGCANFTLEIGDFNLTQQVTIADLDVPGVLGYDFLVKNDCSIDVGRTVINVKGRPIKCEKENLTHSIFHINVNETVVLPPRSETFMFGIADRAPPDDKPILIESTDSKLLQDGVIIAKSVTHVEGSLVPFRAMNLTDEPYVLYKNKRVASFDAEIDIVETESADSENVQSNRINTLSHERGDINSIPYMEPLWESCKSSLSPEHLPIAEELLLKYLDIFAKSKSDIGRTNIVKHKINTDRAHPIKQAPRRIPLAKRAEAENEVQTLLKDGLIEPSSSPWSSPVVLVKKKDGSLRYCIDYRKLNSVTIKDSYPLPRIDDSLDALGGACMFSCIDLASGYWQVEMEPDDKAKTAFSTPKGLFQFKVMPFGLCNAPATFERLMETVLNGLPFQTCLLYIDDIIVYSKDFKTHVERLSEVLERLKNAGLKLSPKKCNFFQNQVSFLGHIVSNEGVSTDPIKISAVKDWPTPKTVHDVRSFLGTCSYYRRFIPGFAHIARPLHKLTEKGKQFSWAEESQASFDKLKTLLISSPILSYPDMSKPFMLDCDASGFSVGAVLSQSDNGSERVVAYFSKTLNKAERNYCVTRRELLAIILAIKHFHHYLYGKHFTVRTDHGALNWLMKFRNPEGQMARWLEQLQAYDFRIEHRPGKSHGNADGLSRRPCNPCDYCGRREQKESENYETEAKLNAIQSVQNDAGENWLKDKMSDLKTAQESDKVLGEIMKRIKAGEPKPAWQQISHLSSLFKAYWAQWNRLCVKENILYREWLNKDGTITLQTVIPKSKQNEILHMLHNCPTAGHLGTKRTIQRVQLRFYWVHYKEHIIQYCASCEKCQQRKSPRLKYQGQMKQYLVAEPLERVAIDILGPLPITYAGNRYILVISDYFTRWTEGYAIPNQESETVAKKFVDEFICRYGVPMQVHTDQGRQFESCLFRSICQLLDIDKTRCTPFRPQSDGLVERFNRTVEDMLSKFVANNQKDWDSYLPLIMLAYRSSRHDSTGFSPCSMMLGREVKLPIDLLYGKPPMKVSDTESKVDYALEIKEKMHEIHEQAKEKMIEASDSQKRKYDVRAHPKQYKKGEKVWLCVKNKTKGLSPKLQLRWEGPYTVVAALSDLIYQLSSSRMSGFKVEHHDRLKPYRERESQNEY